MYRIELSPGEQTAFRSIEELAVAIRRGVVTPHARIWHNASSKWLPIQFHPHYKIAASMQLSPADLVAGAPVKPLELLTLGELMDPPAPPVRSAPEPAPKARTREPIRLPELVLPPAARPEPRARKKVSAKPRRSKSRRRSLHLALAGAVLIAGAHLVLTAASVAPAEDMAVRLRSHRRLVSAPGSLPEQGRPETTAAAVLPGIPVPRPLSTGSSQATSSLGATSGEIATEVQPAPDAVQIVVPASINADSLAPKMVDSTGKKAFKGVLRAIGGTSTPERSRPKR
jgi:hypothetical protein